EPCAAGPVVAPIYPSIGEHQPHQRRPGYNGPEVPGGGGGGGGGGCGGLLGAAGGAGGGGRGRPAPPPPPPPPRRCPPRRCSRAVAGGVGRRRCRG
ncbi:hypothetical protein, partial [Nocardia abscessus]|uniref:hypothetical protein n=1 Tax=Nocardia abscessus TaxID=120957 RepID=UPI002458C075